MRAESPPVAPLWRSAFRPFYLCGAAYAPLLVLVSLAIAADALRVPADGLSLRAWHGHEMLFGFAAAIIAGIVLTALPSWADTREITGGRLQVLVALWLGGRLVMFVPVPAGLAATVDCALFPVMAGMLAPQLLRVKNRLYLLLLPILAGLFAANLAFHLERIATGDAASGFGLRLAVHSIVVLYVLKGGVLTPIFTGNALREKGRGGPITFLPWLDVLATASVVLLAFVDLAGFPARAVGVAALFAFAIHLLRLARWRGWQVADTPLVLVMHLGYAWLVVALLLLAVAGFREDAGAPHWLHAVTVGALGMMMMGLMTRVTLRHTGRPLAVPSALRVAYAAMFAAALLRVGGSLGSLPTTWIVVSALLWAAAFALYLGHCGGMLWRPSLPRCE